MASPRRQAVDRRAPRPHDRVATLLAAVATAALALCALAQLHLGLLDPINQAAPLVLLTAGIALLFLLFRPTRWRRPAAIAAPIVAAWLAIMLLPPHPWPAPRPGDRAIRIVAWNVWLQNRTPDAAAHWIRGQNPDVVILLEAAENGGAIVRALASTFPYRTTCRLEGHCSTMILSRVPPIQRVGLAHGDADNRKALSAALVRFGAPFCACSIVALHLSHSWPAGAQRREVDALIAQMAGVSRDRLIVAGDFNATPWSDAIAWVERGLGVRRADTVLPSWPAPDADRMLPTIWPIDHVLLGSGWSAARVTRGEAVGSDHYPLVVDVVAGPTDDAH